jgi:hypothetical protein
LSSILPINTFSQVKYHEEGPYEEQEFRENEFKFEVLVKFKYHPTKKIDEIFIEINEKLEKMEHETED